MRTVTPASSVEDVLELFERYGGGHYDEEVTQLEHALQCAEHAVDEEASDDLVAAALLHDVGHLLEMRSGQGRPSGEDLGHEMVGVRYLSAVFPASITTPIGLHVLAKRYLCAVDESYADGLSAGSTASLRVQGGPLGPDGISSFEHRPGYADAVSVRRWDDLAKRIDHDAPALGTYGDLLHRASNSGPPRG